jgi:hypothetical protein
MNIFGWVAQSASCLKNGECRAGGLVGGQAGVFYRVSILCNQLLPHLLADNLQTLYSCYGHIEDVHVTF